MSKPTAALLVLLLLIAAVADSPIVELPAGLETGMGNGLSPHMNPGNARTIANPVSGGRWMTQETRDRCLLALNHDLPLPASPATARRHAPRHARTRVNPTLVRLSFGRAPPPCAPPISA